MFEKATQDFKMDPQTEDLVPSGDGLENGMVVLVDDFRHGPLGKEYDKNNNWCLVTHLEHSHPRNPELINFIAVYQDGHKMRRTYNRSYSWYYKLNTDGDALLLDPEDFVHEPPSFPFSIKAVDPLVRVVATYDMMGDLPGPEWFEMVFGYHFEHDEVEEPRHLTTVNGAWGLQYVTFQVDVRVPGVSNDLKNVEELATNKLCELVSDSDIHVHVAQIISID